MKKVFLFLSFLIMLSFTACDDDKDEIIDNGSISIDKTELSVFIGEEIKLAPSFSNEVAANKKVKWTSSNEEVITVTANADKSATVLGKAAGTAEVKIVSEDGTISASCKITVSATEILLNDWDGTLLKVGDKTTISAARTQAPFLDSKKFNWTSSDPKVLVIEEQDGFKCNVTAKGVGSVVIKIESEDKMHSAECNIIVGVGDEGYIVYIKYIDNVQQLISRDLESKEETQITLSTADNTDLSIEGDAIKYKREGIEYFQKLGVFEEYLLEPLMQIACWGDSLTAGGSNVKYPELLGQLTGLLTTNNGRGAQISTQIAARQGAVPLTVTAANNKIPAAGAVAITQKSINILTHAGKYMGAVYGHLAGVYGRLVTNDQGDWTFTRSQAGDEVICPANSVFTIDNGGKENHICIFWYGRNNYGDAQSVRNDIQASVNHLKPLNKKYLVLSVLNGNYGNEKKGGAGYNNIISLNRSLAAIYTNNYLDIRSILISNYDPNDPGDVEDYNNDVVPRSLRSDNIHLNDKGYTIVAQEVQKAMRELGWIN